jgi:hypothetical protein
MSEEFTVSHEYAPASGMFRQKVIVTDGGLSITLGERKQKRQALRPADQSMDAPPEVGKTANELNM